MGVNVLECDFRYIVGHFFPVLAPYSRNCVLNSLRKKSANDEKKKSRIISGTIIAKEWRIDKKLKYSEREMHRIEYKR